MTQHKLKPKRHGLTAATALAAVGVLAFLIGGGISLYQSMTNRANAAHIAAEIDKANRGLPSTMPATVTPDDSVFTNYTVAPDAPRYIYIDKIAVKAVVRPMGLTKDSAIQAPGNVHDAGWYTGSAKPGQPGAMLIDGHVANWATMSVFHNLKSLAPGDIVTIERGDGTKLHYRVVTSQSFPVDKVDMNAAMAPINGAAPGLNLITCDGDVVHGNEFDRRLVVFTQLDQ